MLGIGFALAPVSVAPVAGVAMGQRGQKVLARARRTLSRGST